MKITQTGSVASSGRTKKSEKSGGVGASQAFRDHLDESGTATSTAASGTAPLAALSSLLAIQEAPDSLTGKKRAILHGDTLLDELKELQVGLMQGWVSEDTLQNLSNMLGSQRPVIDDPELNQVLDDIELRAAVELAKLEKSS